MINVQTGDMLSKDSTDKELSEALKVVRMSMKDFKEIEQNLAHEIMTRVREDDKEFAGYWKVIRSTRLYFDRRLFKKKASLDTQKHFEALKVNLEKIQEPFMIKKQGTYLRFPKFG